MAEANEAVTELQLTKDMRSYDPAWSHDGQRIAFLRLKKLTSGLRIPKPEDATEVKVMDADGNNARELAAFRFGREPTLAWSPDDKVLAVGGVLPVFPARGQGYVESAIYLVDTVSRTSPQLWVERGYWPSWSPDGSQIAYTCTSELRPGEYRGSVCVIPAKGRGAPVVIAQNAGQPEWSPDGQNIAYLSWTGGGAELLISHPDGSQAVRITQSGQNALSSYAWSPDGKRLAFTENRPMEEEFIHSGPLHFKDVPQIFVAHLDGTRIGPFEEKDSLWCRDVSWSPDGQFLAAVCTKRVRDRKTRQEHLEESLFLLDSNRPDAAARLVAERGVEEAVFSPR